jgi:hypothetical protein
MTYIVLTSASQIEVFRGNRTDAARYAMALMSNGTREVSIYREQPPSRFSYTRAGRVRL